MITETYFDHEEEKNELVIQATIYIKLGTNLLILLDGLI